MRWVVVALAPLSLAATCEEGALLFQQDLSARRTVNVFNAVSCRSCHELSEVGGFGPRYRAAMLTPSGPVHRFCAGAGCDLEPNGETISFRRPPTLQGIALLSLIEREQIDAWADPTDGDGDGISGRSLGRFGTQGQHDTIRDFVDEAFRMELGVEPTGDEAESVVGFLTSLPPPEPLNRVAEAFQANQPEQDVEARIAAGAVVFDQIGCGDCHRPVFFIGDGEIRAYSDLLVHDMGDLLDDGVSAGSAETFEWRTTPLWGYGHRRSELLHDGRAREIEMTIRFHGGEAAASRDAWFGLSNGERFDLKLFVNSL